MGKEEREMICPLLATGLLAGPQLKEEKRLMAIEAVTCKKSCAWWTGENCAVAELVYWLGKLVGGG